ncbi:MAG: helix-turn-helix domain-containing protein [Limnoraphis sp. WC205]|nr:helix-turn-helix domain-containing protein [Limnoraphis sp. WC205]
MAIAYSEDLRVRALEWLKNGISISQVSRGLKISRPTLYRWKDPGGENRFNGSYEERSPSSTVKNQRLE